MGPDAPATEKSVPAGATIFCPGSWDRIRRLRAGFRVFLVQEVNMKEVKQQWKPATVSMSAVALAVGMVVAMIQPVSAGQKIHESNPCDVRDTCSADPGKYVDYRENGPIKAREYVGEMRWGNGGAPDDVYVVTRTAGSRDLAGAKPCQVRDACINGQEPHKVVRNGPSGAEIPMAKQVESVQVSTQPAQK